MEHYFKKRKWTVEQEEWLIAHKDIRKKNQMYEEFHKAFPSSTFTVAAISTKRTEVGAYGVHHDMHMTAVPLYSERKKKGYVRIKVSKYEWWQKQKWIWVATHPGEPFDIHNQWVFLDGDNTNFNPENIEIVTHRIMGILNRTYGGLIKGEQLLNQVRIIQIALKLAYLDAAQRLGLTKNYGSGRKLRSEINKKARIYHKRKRDEMTPEQKKELNQKRKKALELKLSDPEKRAKWLEQKKKYYRAYALKKKTEGLNGRI